MSKYDSHLKCSFCGKSQEQVRKLIAGPGVYICDECVDLCNEILDEELFDSSAVPVAAVPPNTGRSRTAKVQYSVNRADWLWQNSAGSDFGRYAGCAVCGG